MPRKTTSARSGKSTGSRRSSPAKPRAAKTRSKPETAKTAKIVCGAPLKTKKGGFCSNTAVKGGRCRAHIVEKELSDDLDTLRRLQEAAERHAFFADQEMAGGGNGNKDATFNRNARTAAALAKARLDLKQRAAKTQCDEPAADDDTKIVIVDNARGDGPEPESASESVESGAQPEPESDADASAGDIPTDAADPSEPDDH
jgi:hypothetical protein